MARSCILSEERLFTANDGTNKFCSAHRMSGRNVLAQKTPLAHLAQIVHFADFLAHISEHLSFTENTRRRRFVCAQRDRPKGSQIRPTRVVFELLKKLFFFEI